MIFLFRIITEADEVYFIVAPDSYLAIEYFKEFTQSKNDATLPVERRPFQAYDPGLLENYLFKSIEKISENVLIHKQQL